MFNIKVNRLNSTSKELFIYVLVLFLLLLASINIDTSLQPRKILGIETQQNTNNEKFWQDFLKQNPSYVPGLIETGQKDKANLIDPNYLSTP